MLRKLLNRKVKASTLLEPVIAAVVLTIGISGFSLGITNMVSMGNPQVKLNSQNLLNEISTKAKQEGNYLDETLEFGNMTVYKTVKKYNESDKLYLFSLKATDIDGEVIIEQQEILYLEGM